MKEILVDEQEFRDELGFGDRTIKEDLTKQEEEEMFYDLVNLVNEHNQWKAGNSTAEKFNEVNDDFKSKYLAE